MTTNDISLISRMVANEADMAYRRRVQTIFEWLQPRDTDLILDGGCGRGFYLNFLQRACQARTVGIELDFSYARVGRLALGPTAVVLNGNLDQLGFAASTFDKAILSEVLEHVDNDVQVLRSVARVLKVGGLVAITVPNANYPFWWDPINRLLEAALHVHITKGLFAGIWANHVRLYSMEELRTVVTKSGLEIADERSFTHYSFPFIHNIVYGLGKSLLEANLLPRDVAAAANRYYLSGERGSLLNPVNLGLALFEWFDRGNTMNEPLERSTVNVCILARKPVAWQ